MSGKVAKQGFDALMAGKDMVAGGLGTVGAVREVAETSADQRERIGLV